MVKIIKDLTKDKPWKVIFSFSIPMLLSMVFQQIYSIVDSIIAGNFINADALAAVGASAPITNIYIAIASGLSMGCSVIVSQIFGTKHYTRLKSAISTSVITVAVAAVVFTVIGIVTVNPFMQILKTPENIFEDSALYLQIYVWGIAFLFIYNAANAVFTGLGDSKTPLYFLIFSSVLNVVLDILFVTTFKMGVSGVAWATFIAQGLAGILSMSWLIVKLKKLPGEHKKYKLFDVRILLNIFKIGIPSILQQSFVSVGQLFVQSLINSFGSVVVAGFTAGMKLNLFCIAVVCMFGNALSSYTAQNIGAGKHKRVIDGTKAALVMGVGISAMIMIAFIGFGDKFIELFVGGSGDPEVIKVGTEFLKIVSMFYLVIPVKLVLDGVLRGMGRMGGFMAGTLLDLIARVAFSFILAPIFGYIGIWYSWPIGWVIGTIAVLIAYISIHKSLRKGVGMTPLESVQHS